MPDERPWSEKTPLDNAKGQDAQGIIQRIQQMLQSVGKATSQEGGQPGGTVVKGNPMPSPSPTITFNPTGAPGGIQTAPPRQTSPVPATGSESIGHFANRGEATNAGLVSLGNSLSGMFNAIGQKEHAKKAAMAENYMLQINGLLASGDPNDRQKAMMILEDPKIRKILKTGLEYVPLEEEVPPEATGVQGAIQKIQKQQSGQQPGGQQPQAQGGRTQPIIPQASQEQQLKAAMTSALLQKIKQDPASAITMMGQSQLDSSEKHAEEFYKAGLGLSPVDIQSMNAKEKLEGLKIYEHAVGAAIRGEIDMYKAGIGYKGKVDAATIAGNARKYAADRIKEAWASRDKSRKGGGGSTNYAAGAKIYEDYAKKYLDIVKSGKGADGKPLTADQIKQYQQKADAYQKQADEYLNQVGDQELMELFMKSVEEGPDATEPDKSDDEPR